MYRHAEIRRIFTIVTSGKTSAPPERAEAESAALLLSEFHKYAQLLTIKLHIFSINSIFVFHDTETISQGMHDAPF